MPSDSNSTSTDIEDNPQNLDFLGLLLVVLYCFSLIAITLIIHKFSWLSLSTKDILTLPEFPGISSNTFQIMKKFYETVISPSDDDYLMKYIGFEGVCYIHYMRRMCFLTFFMFCIVLITILPYSFAQSSFDIWNAFYLDDEYYKCFLQFFYIIVLTILVCCFLLRLKRSFKKMYLENKKKEAELGLLKVRTIKLRRLCNEKERSKFNDEKQVRELIHKKIESTVTTPDSIVSIIPVYNKMELFKLGVKLINLRQKKNLQTRDKADENMYKSRIEKMNSKLNKLKENKIQFTGDAYILLDSINSANKFLSKSIGFCMDSCSKCCPATNAADQENLLPESQQTLLIASGYFDPIDILWINISNSNKFLSRAVINSVGTVVILFISTPTAIFNMLKLKKGLKMIPFEEVPELGYIVNLLEKNVIPLLPELGYIVNLLEKNVRPLLILSINWLFLYLINKMGQWKMYRRTSSIQISNFNYSLVYLIFNTFIIPCYSLKSEESVFSFLSKNRESKNIEEQVDTFYVGATGQLFVLLIIQSTCLSFIGSFLRIPENFFNFRLANLRRRQVLLCDKWLKKEGLVFQYGYFYGNNIVFLTIIFTFCSLVPTIILFGSIYFGVRLFCDWYNLVVMHRKEMNSRGILAEKAIYATLYGLIISQVIILNFYLISKLYVNALLTFIIIIGSALFTCIKMNFPICDDRDDNITIRLKEEKNDGKINRGCVIQEINKNNIEEWERMYSCPSIEKDFDKVES